jgi:hypothetical protein
VIAVLRARGRHRDVEAAVAAAEAVRAAAPGVGAAMGWRVLVARQAGTSEVNVEKGDGRAVAPASAEGSAPAAV